MEKENYTIGCAIEEHFTGEYSSLLFNKFVFKMLGPSFLNQFNQATKELRGKKSSPTRTDEIKTPANSNLTVKILMPEGSHIKSLKTDISSTYVSSFKKSLHEEHGVPKQCSLVCRGREIMDTHKGVRVMFHEEGIKNCDKIICISPRQYKLFFRCPNCRTPIGRRKTHHGVYCEKCCITWCVICDLMMTLTCYLSHPMCFSHGCRCAS